MKSIRFIFVAATMSTAAFAADITLTDGRMFKDASISSQTPRNVTIKHTQGLSSVGKDLLPPDLKALYPINEAAARQADEKAVVAREAALNARKIESERIARVLAERQTAAVEIEANQAKEVSQNAKAASSARANAKRLAERYFEKDYSWAPAGSRTASVTIDEIRPADGADGRWFVTGRAVMKIYHASATGNSSFQMGGDSASQWRDQYNANQFDQMNRQAEQTQRASRDNQTNPDSSRNRDSQSSRTSNRSDYSRRSYNDTRDSNPPLFVNYNNHYDEDNNYTFETRNFEAYYSTENGSPSINITVR